MAPFISHVRGVGTVAELMPQDIVVSRAGEKLSDNLNRSHSFHQSVDDAFDSIIGSHRSLIGMLSNFGTYAMMGASILLTC